MQNRSSQNLLRKRAVSSMATNWQPKHKSRRLKLESAATLKMPSRIQSDTDVNDLS